VSSGGHVHLGEPVQGDVVTKVEPSDRSWRLPEPPNQSAATVLVALAMVGYAERRRRAPRVARSALKDWARVRRPYLAGRRRA
jgi:hypothetical protein